MIETKFINCKCLHMRFAGSESDIGHVGPGDIQGIPHPHFPTPQTLVLKAHRLFGLVFKAHILLQVRKAISDMSDLETSAHAKERDEVPPRHSPTVGRTCGLLNSELL